MNLAVFPAQLIKQSPFPAKWAPSRGEPREHQFLYPDEDLALLKHTTIPLCWRIFWGWLARQGQRDSEAMRMNIGDIDLVHGVVRIGKNKTSKKGRSWELAPGDLIAMRNYIERFRRDAKASDPLFLNSKGTRIKHSDKIAPILRAHLRMIGLDQLRPQLFEDTDERMIFHVHNLRSTFITVALAAGESEAWVMRRTGHRTSRMLATYTADVDMLRAVKMPRLTTLDLAIPELAERSTPSTDPGKASVAGQRSDNEISNSAESLSSAEIWHICASKRPKAARAPGRGPHGRARDPRLSRRSPHRNLVHEETAPMLKGSCLCNAVQFELTTLTGPFELCHCNRCRKTSGSAFLAAVGVRREHFRWLRGRDQVQTFTLPIVREPPAYRSCFCKHCGSPMPDPTDDSPVFEVPAGVLEGDLQRTPDKHIFVEHRATWFQIHDPLPQLDETALTRLRADPSAPPTTD